MSSIDLSKTKSRKVVWFYIASLAFIIPAIIFFVALGYLVDESNDSVSSYFDFVSSASKYLTAGFILLTSGLILIVIASSYANSERLHKEETDAVIRSRMIKGMSKEEAYDECVNTLKFKEQKCEKSIKKLYGENIK